MLFHFRLNCIRVYILFAVVYDSFMVKLIFVVPKIKFSESLIYTIVYITGYKIPATIFQSFVK